jgi:hypothetical protein
VIAIVAFGESPTDEYVLSVWAGAEVSKQTTTAITERVMKAWASGKIDRTLIQRDSTATPPASIDQVRLT